MRKVTPSSVTLLNSGAAAGRMSSANDFWKEASTCSFTRLLSTVSPSMRCREVHERGKYGPALPTTKLVSKKMSFLFSSKASSSFTRLSSLVTYCMFGSGGVNMSPSSVLSHKAGLKTPLRTFFLSSSMFHEACCRLLRKALPRITRDSGESKAALQGGRQPLKRSIDESPNLSKFRSTPCGISPRCDSWKRCGINIGLPVGPSDML
mmetsp:Transcript_46297/g.83481  ORF Transcript_46297/g.83481 Transcript_46297/m.83481 type:complete len:207 (+) Transcript_46297:639-1259(+)